jgi:hypothetical protein
MAASRDRRRLAATALALSLAGCAGYDTIRPEEALWTKMEPRLVGMPEARLRQCAGPPLGSEEAGSRVATLRYRASDLTNYCEVALTLRDGTVVSFSADHSAPEFAFLVDGSNYCGRIFAKCAE